jgi:hypothetical protein
VHPATWQAVHEFYSVVEFEVSFSNKLRLLPAKSLMFAMVDTKHMAKRYGP